jgi:uncharacterized RDD family membrane protein YckC
VDATTPTGGMTGPRVPYAGIATRGVALAIDSLIAQGCFVVGAALLGLVGSLVGDLGPDWIIAALLGAGWVLTLVVYFVAFWTTTGQTPGMRLMHVRVLARDGAPPGPARAILRVIGLALAIIPLFAGFLPALIDDRRRALPDFLARTVVVYADVDVPAAEFEPDVSLVAQDMFGQPS